MTSESTEAQTGNSNEGLPDAFAKTIDSLAKAIKDLPQWAQFSAFCLVLALVAIGVVTVSLSKDDNKLLLIAGFGAMLCLFTVVTYAFAARQTRLEKETIVVKDAAERLHAETDKRINRLESIQSQLQGIKTNLEMLPPSNYSKLIDQQITALMNEILNEMEEVGEYRRDLAIARGVEDRVKTSSLYDRINKKRLENR